MRIHQSLRATKKWIVNAWKIIVPVSVLIGIVGFVIVVYPSISINTGQSLDYNDPFRTPFITTNNGFCSIHDFNLVLFINDLQTPSYTIRNLAYSNFQTFNADKIGPNKSITTFIENTAPFYQRGLIENIEIYIHINFNLLSSFYGINEWYRFGARKSSDNKYLWFPYPLIDSVVDNYQHKIDSLLNARNLN